MNGKRAGLYLRVSTKGNGQDVDNQRLALAAACEARGWHITGEFVDDGISGAKGRDKRPEFDRLLKAATNRKIDVVAAWSVDRLGRSLQDLVAFRWPPDRLAALRAFRPSPGNARVNALLMTNAHFCNHLVSNIGNGVD